MRKPLAAIRPLGRIDHILKWLVRPFATGANLQLTVVTPVSFTPREKVGVH